jgi:epoxyqueuosine reductase
MLAIPYRTAEPNPAEPGQGKVSRYAWGQDYHELIWQLLSELAAWLEDESPGSRVRGVVDTAPLLEREFAQLAGLGWIGKNTLLLNRELGSWFFLAALLTDVELEYDEPYAADHCGTCTACLDACPTDAFVAPYVLDARKCISYLTIEHRSSIPADLREGIGDWLFGCDVCQDVCPWNTREHNAAHTEEPTFQPAEGMDPVDLIALFDLDDKAFRARFRHTPLWRAKRGGLLRNAAIVLGNRPTEAAIQALTRGLHDTESLVREACQWALERFEQAHASQVSVSSTSSPGCRPGKSST